MIVAVLLNHVLDFLGVVYLCSVVWKLARGYGIRRAFF
jgi:hypothetical protein